MEREVEVARVEKVARVSSAVCFDIIDDDIIRFDASLGIVPDLYYTYTYTYTNMMYVVSGRGRGAYRGGKGGYKGGGGRGYY